MALVAASKVRVMMTKPVERESLCSPTEVETGFSSAIGRRTSPEKKRLADALRKNAPASVRLDRRLFAVIGEAVGNPGGMVRAELAHGSAEMNGLSARSCEAFACAVEYFHTASLILDDLPAMDDALERRGRICSHLLHGEGYAILGSLALITRGYGLLAEVIAGAPWSTQFRAHRLVEACLGTAGLINGQARDLSGELGPDRPRPAAVALGKTAPLIHLALGLPSILAARESAEQQTLKALSIYWGLLYQGLDDLIDELLPVAMSGKTSGQDARLGRPTVVRQLGHAGAIRYLARLLRLADRRLARLFDRSAAFRFLSIYQEAFRRRLEGVTSALPVPAEVRP